MSFDVLVIGSGLAGATAALSLVERGARVAVASRSYGATALSTGAIDVAYAPAVSPAMARPRSLREHMLDIARHRARHPYAVLGVERAAQAVGDGHALIGRWLAGTGLWLGSLRLEAENTWLASSLGAALPAASALAPHAADLSRATGTWGVVQLDGDSHFDAKRVAAGVAHDLAAAVSASATFVPVPVPIDGRAAPMALAKRFDDVALAEALAQELRSRGRGLAGFILPPVLGLSRFELALSLVRERLGVPVFEALAHMPSVPGLRLQVALEAALDRAKVTRVGGVSAPELRDARVQTVATESGERVAARAIVLASGRFVSGGVAFHQAGREALLGLPLITDLGPLEDDNPSAVVRESPLESHPLMTAGVAVNADLQPLAEGRVALHNVFAAGMVIGGFASRFALCADGVALATGWLAANKALEVTRP